MPPQTHHQRTQTLLLMQKILSKPESSPLTLVLDSVEQGAAGLVKVVVGVAKVRFSYILFFVFSLFLEGVSGFVWFLNWMSC